MNNNTLPPCARFELAKAAMQGLLADHKDHEDERAFHWETPDGKRCDNVYTGPRIKVVDETCEQAVARLSVEHADALLAELRKKDDWRDKFAKVPFLHEAIRPSVPKEAVS